MTRLLDDASAGRTEAAAELLPLVYEELRALAAVKLGSERGGGQGHTLGATALVHEAYLRLVGPREIPWQGRSHFYHAAAQAMRRILIDRARAKYGRTPASAAARRAALAIREVESVSASDNLEGFLALDEALSRLEAIDAQAGAAVRLRFFAGLDIDQTAAALGVSPRTVKRDCAFARGWLREQLEDDNAP